MITIISGMPSWLLELHRMLWNRKDLQDKLFRTATLDFNDYVELQRRLHMENPSRRESAVILNVLNSKISFLQEKSKPLSSCVPSNTVDLC
jgi:hypothetical protein